MFIFIYNYTVGTDINDGSRHSNSLDHSKKVIKLNAQITGLKTENSAEFSQLFAKQKVRFSPVLTAIEKKYFIGGVVLFLLGSLL